MASYTVAVAPIIIGLLLMAAAAALGVFVYFGPVDMVLKRMGEKKSEWDAAAMYLHIFGAIMLLLGVWDLFGSGRTGATLLTAGRSLCAGFVAELFAVHIRMRLPRSRLWFFIFVGFIAASFVSVCPGWQDLLHAREVVAFSVVSLSLPIAGLLMLDIVGHVRDRRYRKAVGERRDELDD